MFKKISVIILIFLISFSTLAIADEWSTSSSKDEMTNEEKWFAYSPDTTTNNPMGFPYSDTQAWLGVGTDGDNEWVYIGFTKQPNIKNTTPTNDGYSTFTTRVKWNDDITNMDFTQEWGSDFVHFVEDKKAINKIMQNNKVLIEIDWYGEDKVYFEFTLEGSAEAIKKIREETN
ncbi:MAG: hypothetical protein K9K76_00880 [Halanaerobiales bacterium]|nr:hypothetical protein [Halanaerobiales bacterium]